MPFVIKRALLVENLIGLFQQLKKKPFHFWEYSGENELLQGRKISKSLLFK